MNQAEIRDIVVAQAIEETDLSGRLVSDGEKRHSDAVAGAPLPQGAGPEKQNAFLAKRAASLIGTVESRLEGERDWLSASPFRARFSLFSLILLVVAAVTGYLTNELDQLGTERKINLLSFPLIGIIVWSLLVYLSEIVVLFRKEGEASGLSGILARALFPPIVDAGKGEENETSAEVRARSLFQSRWRRLNLPPLSAKMKSLLHFTALTLAAAAITGMYVRGLAFEYIANWESTFFKTGADLKPFLDLVLGPAAALQGSELPSVADLDTLRTFQGENAARWIHWYAVTVAIYVLIPRFGLGIFWMLRASKMEKTMAFREVSPAYYERLIAVSTGHSLSIAIVPYAHEPGANVKQGIRSYMELEFERPVTIHWEDSVSFGDEEDAVVEIGGKKRQPMLLFNFASTPEKETHLALYHRLSGLLEEGAKGYHIILDCEAFDRKSESFNDAPDRRAARLDAWRKLFAAENCKIHVISDHDFPANTTRHA